MVKILLIPVEEFRRVRASATDKYDKLALLADMCRANTLATVKRAGSGHLGSSFSSLDIVTMLYCSEMNTAETGVENAGRDIYLDPRVLVTASLASPLNSTGRIPYTASTRRP